MWSNINPSFRYWIPPLKWLFRGLSEPHIPRYAKIQNVAITVCLSKLDSETLFLKILHTLVIRHGKIKLVLIQKLPLRLSYTILGGAIEVAREKPSTVSNACELH